MKFIFKYKFKPLLPPNVKYEANTNPEFTNNGFDANSFINKIISDIKILSDKNPFITRYLVKRNKYNEKIIKEVFIKVFNNRNKTAYHNLPYKASYIYQYLVSKMEIRKAIDTKIDIAVLDDINLIYSTSHQLIIQLSANITGYLWSNDSCPVHKNDRFFYNYFCITKPSEYSDDQGRTWKRRPAEVDGQFPVFIKFGCKCTFSPFSLGLLDSTITEKDTNNNTPAPSFSIFFNFCSSHNIYKFRFTDVEINSLLEDFKEEIIPNNCQNNSVAILLYIVGRCYYIKQDYGNSIYYLKKSIERDNLSKERRVICINILRKIDP